jgi:Zinc metalloprotease (elastase)
MVSRPHVIECILPPHIQKKIVENGTPVQRSRVIQTIQVTDQLREARQAMAGVPAPVKPEAAPPAKQRTIYSADNTTTLPGQVVRQEGGPAVGDAAVDEAYIGAGATYDLYWDIYQRSSVDGNGMPLNSTVHYDKNYENAFWNGQQMVYGDGDEDLPVEQRIFNRFTIAIDVIGHELTHGVTQYTGNLDYANQPGALNESFSDVFGSLVKQYKLGQAAKDADWIIGQGLLAPNIKGVGIRSMKAPGTAYDDPLLGKDPQPADMQGYVTTTDDSGGVHINSGIPNHAFYLAAIEIGGFAWVKTGKIWYVTLRDKIKSSSNFQDAANLTFATAGELFGVNSLEQQAVSKGWAGVGIIVTKPEQPGCLPGLQKLLMGH